MSIIRHPDDTPGSSSFHSYVAHHSSGECVGVKAGRSWCVRMIIRQIGSQLGSSSQPLHIERLLLYPHLMFCTKWDSIFISGIMLEYHSNAYIPTSSAFTFHLAIPTVLHCLEVCNRYTSCRSASYTSSSQKCITSSLNYFKSNDMATAHDDSVLYSLVEVSP